MTTIRLHTTMGSVAIDLEDARAPQTVKNFTTYINDGHYNGTLFHRVIPGFMVQGGGMLPGMKEKATRPAIANEAGNGLKNKRGTIAMARTSAPHSATSQFFINVADNAFLDFRMAEGDGWGYCVFGQVSEGMEVIDKIVATKTGRVGPHQDVPQHDIIIETVEIVTA